MTKVMIVEDEPELRDMIRSIVTYEGYETATAENGDDFLQKIDEFQPDFVTLDVMMPGLSTWEILDGLKNKTTCPRLVLLTAANISTEEKERLKATGQVIGVMSKPFDVDELIGMIRQITKK